MDSKKNSHDKSKKLNNSLNNNTCKSLKKIYPEENLHNSNIDNDLNLYNKNNSNITSNLNNSSPLNLDLINSKVLYYTNSSPFVSNEEINIRNNKSFFSKKKIFFIVALFIIIVGASIAISIVSSNKKKNDIQKRNDILYKKKILFDRNFQINKSYSYNKISKNCINIFDSKENLDEISRCKCYDVSSEFVFLINNISSKLEVPLNLRTTSPIDLIIKDASDNNKDDYNIYEYKYYTISLLLNSIKYSSLNEEKLEFLNKTEDNCNNNISCDNVNQSSSKNSYYKSLIHYILREDGKLILILKPYYMPKNIYDYMHNLIKEFSPVINRDAYNRNEYIKFYQNINNLKTLPTYNYYVKKSNELINKITIKEVINNKSNNDYDLPDNSKLSNSIIRYFNNLGNLETIEEESIVNLIESGNSKFNAKYKNNLNSYNIFKENSELSELLKKEIEQNKDKNLDTDNNLLSEHYVSAMSSRSSSTTILKTYQTKDNALASFINSNLKDIVYESIKDNFYLIENNKNNKIIDGNNNNKNNYNHDNKDEFKRFLEVEHKKDNLLIIETNKNSTISINEAIIKTISRNLNENISNSFKKQSIYLSLFKIKKFGIAIQTGIIIDILPDEDKIDLQFIVSTINKSFSLSGQTMDINIKGPMKSLIYKMQKAGSYLTNLVDSLDRNLNTEMINTISDKYSMFYNMLNDENKKMFPEKNQVIKSNLDSIFENINNKYFPEVKKSVDNYLKKFLEIKITNPLNKFRDNINKSIKNYFINSLLKLNDSYEQLFKIININKFNKFIKEAEKISSKVLFPEIVDIIQYYKKLINDKFNNNSVFFDIKTEFFSKLNYYIKNLVSSIKNISCKIEYYFNNAYEKLPFFKELNRIYFYFKSNMQNVLNNLIDNLSNIESFVEELNIKNNEFNPLKIITNQGIKVFNSLVDESVQYLNNKIDKLKDYEIYKKMFNTLKIVYINYNNLFSIKIPKEILIIKIFEEELTANVLDNNSSIEINNTITNKIDNIIYSFNIKFDTLIIELKEIYNNIKNIYSFDYIRPYLKGYNLIYEIKAFFKSSGLIDYINAIINLEDSNETFICSDITNYYISSLEFIKNNINNDIDYLLEKDIELINLVDLSSDKINNIINNIDPIISSITKYNIDSPYINILSKKSLIEDIENNIKKTKHDIISEYSSIKNEILEFIDLLSELKNQLDNKLKTIETMLCYFSLTNMSVSNNKINTKFTEIDYCVVFKYNKINFDMSIEINSTTVDCIIKTDLNPYTNSLLNRIKNVTNFKENNLMNAIKKNTENCSNRVDTGVKTLKTFSNYMEELNKINFIELINNNFNILNKLDNYYTNNSNFTNKIKSVIFENINVINNKLYVNLNYIINTIIDNIFNKFDNIPEFIIQSITSIQKDLISKEVNIDLLNNQILTNIFSKLESYFKGIITNEKLAFVRIYDNWVSYIASKSPKYIITLLKFNLEIVKMHFYETYNKFLENILVFIKDSITLEINAKINETINKTIKDVDKKITAIVAKYNNKQETLEDSSNSNDVFNYYFLLHFVKYGVNLNNIISFVNKENEIYNNYINSSYNYFQFISLHTKSLMINLNKNYKELIINYSKDKDLLISKANLTLKDETLNFDKYVSNILSDNENNIIININIYFLNYIENINSNSQKISTKKEVVINNQLNEIYDKILRFITDPNINLSDELCKAIINKLNSVNTILKNKAGVLENKLINNFVKSLSNELNKLKKEFSDYLVNSFNHIKLEIQQTDLTGLFNAVDNIDFITNNIKTNYLTNLFSNEKTNNILNNAKEHIIRNNSLIKMYISMYYTFLNITEKIKVILINKNSFNDRIKYIEYTDEKKQEKYIVDYSIFNEIIDNIDLLNNFNSYFELSKLDYKVITDSSNIDLNKYLNLNYYKRLIPDKFKEKLTDIISYSQSNLNVLYNKAHLLNNKNLNNFKEYQCINEEISSIISLSLKDYSNMYLDMINSDINKFLNSYTQIKYTNIKNWLLREINKFKENVIFNKNKYNKISIYSYSILSIITLRILPYLKERVLQYFNKLINNVKLLIINDKDKYYIIEQIIKIGSDTLDNNDLLECIKLIIYSKENTDIFETMYQEIINKINKTQEHIIINIKNELDNLIQEINISINNNDIKKNIENLTINNSNKNIALRSKDAKDIFLLFEDILAYLIQILSNDNAYADIKSIISGTFNDEDHKNNLNMMTDLIEKPLLSFSENVLEIAFKPIDNEIKNRIKEGVKSVELVLYEKVVKQLSNNIEKGSLFLTNKVKLIIDNVQKDISEILTKLIFKENRILNSYIIGDNIEVNSIINNTKFYNLNDILNLKHKFISILDIFKNLVNIKIVKNTLKKSCFIIKELSINSVNILKNNYTHVLKEFISNYIVNKKFDEYKNLIITFSTRNDSPIIKEYNKITEILKKNSNDLKYYSIQKTVDMISELVDKTRHEWASNIISILSSNAEYKKSFKYGSPFVKPYEFSYGLAKFTIEFGMHPLMHGFIDASYKNSLLAFKFGADAGIQAYGQIVLSDLMDFVKATGGIKSSMLSIGGKSNLILDVLDSNLSNINCFELTVPDIDTFIKIEIPNLAESIISKIISFFIVKDTEYYVNENGERLIKYIVEKDSVNSFFNINSLSYEPEFGNQNLFKGYVLKKCFNIPKIYFK